RERAGVLTEQGKPRDALADWDRAVALAPAAARTAARLGRADGLARAGEHDRAAAEAAALSRSPGLSAEDAHNPAGAFALTPARASALSAAAAGRDAARPLPLRERHAEERARAAVALLGRAARAGYFRDAANVTHMGKDADLDFLRGRADFSAFAAGLRGPAKGA